MLRQVKIWGLILLILSMTVAFADHSQSKVSKAQDFMTENFIENSTEMEKIYETDTFIYSFKEDRDVLYVYDKRNNYTWKSGLDIAPAKDVKAALRKDEPLGFEPLEKKMNETFTGIANSLITIEYYDDSLGIKRIASASKGANSSLEKVIGENNHFILNIQYTDQDIAVKVHLMFTENGYDLFVENKDITGTDKDRLAAVLLNPFLGASGGVHALYDIETGKHGDDVAKESIPGYVFIPDGPGALIHFNDYNVSLREYTSRVYGENYSKSQYYTHDTPYNYVPFKNPLMPVYGMAHTDDQAAFVGYASSGDEFMEIVVMPEENTTLYTWAYPRFIYNNEYFQVFNKSGEGYFTLFEEANEFDIKFHYEFLADAENGSADYVGMAKTYQKYLVESGLLKAVDQSNEMPLRVDFIQSDVKKSVLGLENVVVTSAQDIQKILTNLNENDIKKASVGLYGWQEGGVTTGKPWQSNWSNSIGSKSEFEELVKSTHELGFDISFAQDYLRINEEQVNVQGKVIKHMSNWYLKEYDDFDLPVHEFYFVKPDLSIEYLEKQLAQLLKLDVSSHTIEGISSNLITEHGNDPLSEQEVVKIYQESFDGMDVELNFKTPNQYLWAYTDRFLQAPVFSTQYIIETETVPFLQMVLNGKMEVFGPYANFSFSEQEDILKMIDYNLSPAFILSEKDAYLLSATNSRDLFSTEYSQYNELISEVYAKISSALNPVRNSEWLNREAVKKGVVVNTYDNGVQIVINYSNDTFEYNDKKIKALSFEVFY